MRKIGGICGGTGDMRNAYKMSIPKPHWNTATDGKIVPKFKLQKCGVTAWTGFM